ncbi:hypothetical protein M9M90_19685 [Phenylobacterium sp. LH3H17]|uniref:hypothetical protein n=1 Tax=Phenylobacterium sp. LH3H17 TaxID=2903901 RepID=UPI0020C99BE7|nr:hypothetical protein [Phenylobacterium sp. LH3H17]UTP39404.1 hypothetical protein M9M90_19685 [Phenylobacterium sp. LH3H17]
MKRALPILLAIAGLTAVAAFGGWTFYAGSSIGGGWSSLGPIMLYVVGGLLVVGALTGGLMWLAFHSARHGYDEPYDVNRPGGGRPDSKV